MKPNITGADKIETGALAMVEMLADDRLPIVLAPVGKAQVASITRLNLSKGFYQ